ncbi:MAG: HD-GYP domain-containing protein [Magnetococcus sp. YQC-3]
MTDLGKHWAVTRKKVMTALLFSALFLSLACSGLAFLFEVWRTERQFESLATKAASTLTDRMDRAWHADGARVDDAMLSNFLAERYEAPGGHFISVRILDRDGHVVAQAEEHRFPHILNHRQLETTSLVLPYRELVRESGTWFVIVVQELAIKNGKFRWLFQGVYHLEPETTNRFMDAVSEVVSFTVLAVILTAAGLYPVILHLQRDVVRHADDVMRSHAGMLRSLGNAIAKRDSDTYTHNHRVTYYAVSLAERAGVPRSGITALIKGAFLHDLGKIAISDTILLKPGKLTDEEMTIMRTHVQHGLDIVAQIPWLIDAAETIGGHHERWDGTGYPSGLAAEGIPLNARIFSLADVFDALTSRRPYKEPLPLEKALSILRQESGTHFDPRLTEIFVQLAPVLLEHVLDDEHIHLRTDTITKSYFES